MNPRRKKLYSRWIWHWNILLAMFLLVGPVRAVGIEDNAGPRYTDLQSVFFEFGLKITSNGKSNGVLGTVPIPVDWPEQVITVVKQNKTDNLRKFSFKDLTPNTRQLILKANRLSAGEIAQGSIVVRADKRSIELPDDTSKLFFAKKVPTRLKQYLKPSPYIESNHKRMKALAQSIGLDEDADAWDQVETIYQWVRENVEYQFDTQIHSCLDALATGHGDCEELSSIFIAICRAKRIPARAVWIPTHTYPEFYLVDDNGNGYWFPCQAAGSYEFGSMAEIKPILQKGDRFKLPGNPKPMRYVQPTLVAKDAAGGLSIEFIARQIVDEDELKNLRAMATSK